jgi:hypothetical protein
MQPIFSADAESIFRALRSATPTITADATPRIKRRPARRFVPEPATDDIYPVALGLVAALLFSLLLWAGLLFLYLR